MVNPSVSNTDVLPSRYPDGVILRSISELAHADPKGEDLLHLSNARVVLADYDLLQHDFPCLRTKSLLRANSSLRNADAPTRRETIRTTIDRWLVANAGFVSTTQASQEVVNTTIRVDDITARGYRPEGYGRAIVIPVSQRPAASLHHPSDANPGLLDLKGVGVAPGKTPSLAPSSNGLLALEDALREYLMQRVVDGIFARELPSFWTVPTYAILSLGFGLLGTWRGAPAGMLVRRAHRRPLSNSPDDPAPHQAKLGVELLLRSYGLTGANPATTVEIYQTDGRVCYGNRSPECLSPEERGLCMALKGDADYIKIEGHGVQTAGDMRWPPPSGLMVDFGTIYARRSFDHPLALDRYFSLNLSRPNTPGFVQPDPSKALPFATWRPRSVAINCHRLAWRFCRNELTSAELRTRLEVPLRALHDLWSLRQALV